MQNAFDHLAYHVASWRMPNSSPRLSRSRQRLSQTSTTGTSIAYTTMRGRYCAATPTQQTLRKTPSSPHPNGSISYETRQDSDRGFTQSPEAIRSGSFVTANGPRSATTSTRWSR